MTAIVILNVIGAILIVTAIISGLAWAVVRDRGGQLAFRPVRPQRVPQPSRRRRTAQAALDLQ
jgi:hypothetical protein